MNGAEQVTMRTIGQFLADGLSLRKLAGNLNQRLIPV